MGLSPLMNAADIPTMRVFLETERLILRRFTQLDVDNLVELDSSPDVMRFVSGGTPTPREVIENDVLPAFLSYHDRFAEYGFWAAIEKNSGRFLGWFHFRPPPGGGAGEIELGYRLCQEAWGKGYATEGAVALIRKGFSEGHVERVVASTLVIHTASRRVMEKAGLKPMRTFYQAGVERIEGNEQGCVEYALTRAEWQRGQAELEREAGLGG